VRFENSPSKVAATEKPFSHFASALAETSAAFAAGEAPNTVKPEAGSVWKIAETLRSVLKLCAHAARPPSVMTASPTRSTAAQSRPRRTPTAAPAANGVKARDALD